MGGTVARSTYARTNVAGMPLDDAAALERALPAPLASFAAPIVASRAMLDLEVDWDGEGSPGYAEATWLRAVRFLLANALGFYDDYGLAVPAPKVGKGPYGSVDLHWRVPGRHLLMNMPVEAGEPGDFYGDDGAGGQQVKGSFDPDEEYPWLMMWLANP